MKIKCTVTFTFDAEDQTLKEVKKYLKSDPGECLEWMGDDAKFVFVVAHDDVDVEV